MCATNEQKKNATKKNISRQRARMWDSEVPEVTERKNMLTVNIPIIRWNDVAQCPKPLKCQLQKYYHENNRFRYKIYYINFQLR